MSLDLSLIFSDFNFTMDNSNKHKIYEFEEFRLDAVHLMLYQDNEEISLAPKAVETLVALVEKRGKILSKDELMETIWTDSIVEESNLSKYLHILRKTLGNQQNGKPLIETFRRRGYRFNGEVSVVDFLPETESRNNNENLIAFRTSPNSRAIKEATTRKVVALADWRHEPLPDEKSSQTLSPTARKKEFSSESATPNAERLTGEIKSRKLGFAVGLILLLFVSMGLGYRFFANRSLNADVIESVAVLPFENTSGDESFDYLSDGLSESVIDRLAQVSQLKVIARSSSFKYRGNADLSEVANELNVRAIVTGRVARRGDDLIIRVEMIDTRNNRQLWSDNFTRNPSNIQKLQTDISHLIIENLHLHLSGTQTQQLAKQETSNSQAYELLLKGRFYWRKGGTENYRKALEYYEQAITADPNYALAYAELSAAYSVLSANGFMNPKELIPKADAARKALELDGNLAEAHLAMAILNQTAWDWAATESAFQRAVELNPNLANVRFRYSAFLSFIGRHDEAIIEAKRARELDPLSLRASQSVADAFLFARRFDEAIAESEKMLELDKNYIPAHYTLGYSYTAKGMYAEAIAKYQEIMRLGGDSTGLQIYLGTAYARSGEREKALNILKQLETDKDSRDSGELPVIYVALGEREKAFASFEKAYATHDSQLQYLKVELNFDSLRDDVRFQDLLRRVGLPQ